MKVHLYKATKTLFHLFSAFIYLIIFIVKEYK